jgi:hypothetical protein
MSAAILRFPTRPSAPQNWRIVVADTGDHGCPTCPACGRWFKQDLGYWPLHSNGGNLVPVCLDCAGIHDLCGLVRKLGELQDDVWRLHGEEGIVITRMEIPWPGGVITMIEPSFVVFERGESPKRRAAR